MTEIDPKAELSKFISILESCKDYDKMREIIPDLKGFTAVIERKTRPVVLEPVDRQKVSSQLERDRMRGLEVARERRMKEEKGITK